MLTDNDLAQMQHLENNTMPSMATIMVSTRTKNQSGNYIYTFTPTAYDEDSAVPCRVMAGASSDDLVLLGNLQVSAQVWTVTFEAGTNIKGDDRVWIQGWSKYIAVKAIADGGDYETAVVALCVDAL